MYPPEYYIYMTTCLIKMAEGTVDRPLHDVHDAGIDPALQPHVWAEHRDTALLYEVDEVARTVPLDGWWCL